MKLFNATVIAVLLQGSGAFAESDTYVIASSHTTSAPYQTGGIDFGIDALIVNAQTGAPQECIVRVGYLLSEKTFKVIENKCGPNKVIKGGELPTGGPFTQISPPLRTPVKYGGYADYVMIDQGRKMFWFCGMIDGRFCASAPLD